MSKKVLISIIVYLAIVGYFLYESFRIFSVIPSAHSLDFNKVTFTSLASDIVNQAMIYEMDDCSRSTKRLNGVYIRITPHIDKSDSMCCPDSDCCPIYYKQALDSLQINHQTFESFKQRLSDTKLRSYYKSGDSVLFIVDGFMDDSWGFLYNPKSLCSTKDIYEVGNYSVKNVDSLDGNWQRVEIH